MKCYLQFLLLSCAHHYYMLALLNMLLINEIAGIRSPAPVSLLCPPGTHHAIGFCQNDRPFCSSYGWYGNCRSCEEGFKLCPYSDACMPDQTCPEWSPVPGQQISQLAQRVGPFIVDYMANQNYTIIGDFKRSVLALLACGRSLSKQPKARNEKYIYYKFILLAHNAILEIKIFINQQQKVSANRENPIIIVKFARAGKQQVSLGKENNFRFRPKRMLLSGWVQPTNQRQLFQKLFNIRISNPLEDRGSLTGEQIYSGNSRSSLSSSSTSSTFTSSSSSSSFSSFFTSSSTSSSYTQNAYLQPPAIGLVNFNASLPNLNNVKLITAQEQLGPINRSIDQNQTYIEFMDASSLFGTDVMRSINKYLRRYYIDLMSSFFLRASVAENQTYFFIRLAFRKVNYIYSEPTFIVNKNTSFMELAEDLTGKNFVQLMIDFSNREAYIQNLDPEVRYLIKQYVEYSAYYQLEAQIYMVSTIKISETVQRIYIRYHFPQQFDPPYDQVQFRYEIDSKNLSKTQQKGVVIFPKLQFIPDYSLANRDYLLKFLLIQWQQIPDGGLVFISSNVSTEIKDLFRTRVNYMNKWVLDYELLISGDSYKRLLNNRSFSEEFNAYRISKIVVLEDSAPPPPQTFNLSYFLQKFPGKKLRPVTLPLMKEDAIEQTGQLSTAEVVDIINSIFRTYSDSIINVSISARVGMRDYWDTYVVEYTEHLTIRTTPAYQNRDYYPSRLCRFVFQMVARRGNIILKGQLVNVTKVPNVPVVTVKVLPKLLLAKPLVPTVTLQPTQASNKTIKFLSAIFNKSFMIDGTSAKASPPIPSSLNPRIHYSQLKDPITNSTRIIQDFLTHIPDIIPLQFQQNPDKNEDPETLTISNPEPVSQEVIQILEQANTPAIYRSELIISSAQRAIAGRPDLKMIQLKHIFYGTMRVWVSIGKMLMLKMKQVDNGFQLSTFDISLIAQTPELSQAHSTISQQLASIFSIHRYNDSQSSDPSHKLERVPEVEDIKLWKYKRIRDIIEVEYTYSFVGFIIRAGIIFRTNGDQVTDYVLFLLEVFNNKVKKYNEERLRLESIALVQARVEWPKIESFYLSNFRFLSRSNLQDIKFSSSTNYLLYSLTFLTAYGRVQLDLTFNPITDRISLASYKSRDEVTQTFIDTGCRIAELRSCRCLQCQLSYYFYEPEGKCYEIVAHCVSQSGQLCLACQNGFILTADFKCA